MNIFKYKTTKRKVMDAYQQSQKMIAVYEEKRVIARQKLDEFAAGYWAGLANEKRDQGKLLLSLLE